MKNKQLYIFFIILTGVIVGCASANLTQAEQWLDSKTSEAPRIDISGEWDGGDDSYSMSQGWGKGGLTQDKNGNVKGEIGQATHYKVVGKVVGNKVYLIMLIDNKVNYHLFLKPERKKYLVGKYISGLAKKDSDFNDGYPVQLISMKKIKKIK